VIRGFVFAAVGLALAAAFACSSGISDAELAQRVETSHPTWQSYSEEIKAQLGAGPAAEWEGTLREVRVETNGILVTFALSGPWAGRNFAAPVLLNEPFAGVHQSASAERKDNRVTYVFPLQKIKDVQTMPWVELKFPSGHRRVALSQGTWKATQ
jgi:hypothetical protein